MNVSMKACENIQLLPLYILQPLWVIARLNITPLTMLFTVPSITSILQIHLKPHLFSELHHSSALQDVTLQFIHQHAVTHAVFCKDINIEDAKESQDKAQELSI